MEICDYCKKENDTSGFFIGASTEPSWTMHEGTGKLSCPDCYEMAKKEAKQAMGVKS